MPHTIQRFNFGGRDITAWLRKILIERGNFFTKSSEMEIVRDIKEKLYYVAINYDAVIYKSKSGSDCDAYYKIPDGNIIMISVERFRNVRSYIRIQVPSISELGISSQF